MGRNGFRTITDIDILAFRFPSGVPSLPGRKTPQGLDTRDIDDDKVLAAANLFQSKTVWHRQRPPAKSAGFRR